MDLVLIAIYANSHTLFDVRRRHRFCQINNKLGKLLDVDHVLGVTLTAVSRRSFDDFCATGDLWPNLKVEGDFVFDDTTDPDCTPSEAEMEHQVSGTPRRRLIPSWVCTHLERLLALQRLFVCC